MRERRKGTNQERAAARAGMSVKTARKYERAGQLPSQLKQPRTWRTRANPFEEDWPWVVKQLERDSALQGATLFAELCQRHPGKYRSTQVRTLQRHIAQWRAQHGPEREVIFEQVHVPGERAQSDFTHMSDLQVTINGQAFPHLLYHLVLTYSNVEAVRVCFGETFEALAEGIEQALWQIGGVPAQHRTDHLSAAVRHLPTDEQEAFSERYQGLMAHYGMQPTWNNAGIAHENGDVEQSHFRFKEAVDQALRVRGSRDFSSRLAYERFVQDLVRNRNLTRVARWQEEQAALRPLPRQPLTPCRELRVSVSRFSTIHVLSKTYSVPSRLIGTAVLVRVRAETVEVYVGTNQVMTLPRLQGATSHAVNYRHVIWSLVRKPGAFAELTLPGGSVSHPGLPPRLRCLAQASASAGRSSLCSCAASGGDDPRRAEVETAISILLENEQAPTFDAVRDLVRIPQVPVLGRVNVDLDAYDQLLPSQQRRAHG
jgi:Mu transposase, C-terminal domain